MSLPICANGPVSGASMPIRMAPVCAWGGVGTARSATSTIRTASRRMQSPSLPVPAGERTEHAAGREEDDADVDGAQDQEPALGVNADEIFQEHDGGGAEGGTGEGAGAAQRDHEECLHGGHELDVDRAHEAVVVGPQHAREAGEE